MDKFSITSAAGYARIAVAVFAGVVLLHHLTLLEATATIAFVGTAIGSAGLIAAKDANGPSPSRQPKSRPRTAIRRSQRA
jgi:hypothetical protein